jgi:hypothetical protein
MKQTAHGAVRQPLLPVRGSPSRLVVVEPTLCAATHQTRGTGHIASGHQAGWRAERHGAATSPGPAGDHVTPNDAGYLDGCLGRVRFGPLRPDHVWLPHRRAGRTAVEG